MERTIPQCGVMLSLRSILHGAEARSPAQPDAGQVPLLMPLTCLNRTSQHYNANDNSCEKPQQSAFSSRQN